MEAVPFLSERCLTDASRYTGALLRLAADLTAWRVYAAFRSLFVSQMVAASRQGLAPPGGERLTAVDRATQHVLAIPADRLPQHGRRTVLETRLSSPSDTRQ
jgi:hypothetical protein